MQKQSRAILDSLKNTPLLAHDLPVAQPFDRSLFGDVRDETVLKFDQKLGHLYEDALETLIAQSPSLSCVAGHVQVFDDTKRTLGEMDFIVYDHVHNHHIHLELAVKFYLAVPDENGWLYPGPNARDNWNRKLDHMLNHQLTLGQTPEAQSMLNDRFNIQTLQAQHLIYGRLFIPIDCDMPPEPAMMAGDKQTGRWLYVSQWQDYFGDVQNVFHIPKPLWPIEINHETMGLFETITAEHLITRAENHCTMVIPEGSKTPVFVAPNTWG